MPPTTTVPNELLTDRLRLRRWRSADYDAFAAMNADERVMEFMPSTLTRAESDALAARVDGYFDAFGYGLWAVERRADEAFLGWTGLSQPGWAAHFTPAVEVGWRLGGQYWNQGYATEAARAALADGFRRAGLHEIVSFTFAGNARSRRVMEKLGMHRNPADDFMHPKLPADHRLQPHVLYRLQPHEFGSAAR